jgi:DNA-binding IclR family transcriptional regulator
MRSDSIDLILSSAAKLKILKVLNNQSTPLRLRQIAYLSELPVRSVQLALKSLLEAKVLAAKKGAGIKAFILSREHALYPFIADICEALERQAIRESSQSARNAADYAAFNAQALALLNSASSEKQWT